jgi:hypothetical protein
MVLYRSGCRMLSLLGQYFCQLCFSSSLCHQDFVHLRPQRLWSASPFELYSTTWVADRERHVYEHTRVYKGSSLFACMQPAALAKTA